MKKAILTFGLFSMLMVLTSFTAPAVDSSRPIFVTDVSLANHDGAILISHNQLLKNDFEPGGGANSIPKKMDFEPGGGANSVPRKLD